MASEFDLDASRIIEVFNQHQVLYIVIGAFAALAQGAPIPATRDIDFTPASDSANLAKLSDALKELRARIRTEAVPEGLPFDHDGTSLGRSNVWNLICDAGEFDLSFRPTGTDGFTDLTRRMITLQIAGQAVPLAHLADIIRSKTAAGRPKDLQVLPLLNATLRQRDQQTPNRTERRNT